VLKIDQNENLIQNQVIKSELVEAGGSADIHISPDGQFLYTSNRL
jgi:6-phosphogluconolactonase (cycloisomerase 2 family)